MKLPVKYTDLKPHEKRPIREAYIEQQNQKCAHCGECLFDSPSTEVLNKSINKRLFPKGFFDHPIHLHHNHNTGMTIGAVHSICNAVLWQYYYE